jgi:acyl-CoA dehydrogenase
MATHMQTLFWDDTHLALKQSVDRWVHDTMTPFTADWEAAKAFPIALYGQAAEAGLLGVGYPEEYGGSGGDIFHALIVCEALIRGGSPGTAAGVCSHSIALPPILAFGTQAQKLRFVPPVLSGQKIAALGITEPGAGSDVAGIRTRAVLDGDHYIVNGAKTFITSGSRADLVTTLVRTGPDRHGGLTLLVIERGTPGFSTGAPLQKMGWEASDTAELFFEDCRVPIENRLGDEGQGFLGIMVNFVAERLTLAASCVAIAQLALDRTLVYVDQREAFGRTLAGFQVTRHKLAEMATRTEAARSFVSVVAEAHRREQDVTTTVAMAKNTAADACSFVTDAAVQLHGGMGYMRESLVEQLYRDARLYPIGGGTTEIMRELISKRMLHR